MWSWLFSSSFVGLKFIIISPDPVVQIYFCWAGVEASRKAATPFSVLLLLVLENLDFANVTFSSEDGFTSGVRISNPCSHEFVVFTSVSF